MNQKRRYPTALTIAGSDSGGGAGIQADLKTFSAMGVFGASVLTAITAQNTREVRQVEILPTSLVRLQLETVFDDIKIDAVKTGMLPTPEIIEVVADIVDRYAITNLIIDPVMVATSGSRLTSVQTADSFREFLFPRLSLLTPNIPEAEVLTGLSILSQDDMRKAGNCLLQQGCRAVLIKGGHLAETRSSDILFQQGEEPLVLSSDHIATDNLHGTGCSLASAITAGLAVGQKLSDAIASAKRYITGAIDAGQSITTGQGNGPVNHFYNPQPLKIIGYED